MADALPKPVPEDAFCVACGYPLRALSVDRCPECGLRFDPKNPKTMIRGRPLRRWQQALLRPIGWPTILLPLLATLGLIYLSGWPQLPAVPWQVVIAEFRWPGIRQKPTAPDVVFYAAVVLWILFLTIAALRIFLRIVLVPGAARSANNPARQMNRRRPQAMAAAAIISIVCVVFGWQQRIGKRWIARASAVAPVSASNFVMGPNPSRYAPVPLTDNKARWVLSVALRTLRAPRERITALGLLAEHFGRAGMTEIQIAAGRERDPGVLVWELRLIGLCRDPQSEPFLAERLRDSRPQVRAAAADAIGIIRHPSYSVLLPDGFWICDVLSLDSVPPIGLGSIVGLESKNFSWGGFKEHDLSLDPAIALPASVRESLLAMMTAGATSEEREAAARALVGWPPDQYKLRVAEWGVWIESDGHIALAKSILDEIPPFVHRTGNSVADFQGYFLYPSIVTKPIIHLTADQPLAADVEVHIREGRPWFGYPKPDDFGIGVEPETQQSETLGNAGGGFRRLRPRPAPDDYAAPAIAPMVDRREGYPWLVPHHRLYPSDWVGDPSIFCLGLRWQSLVVSPNLLSGEAPITVPNDQRFNWWKRLREVPGSWVTNRGETERFLYYDGPTRADVPMMARMEKSGQRLVFTEIPPDKPVGVPRYTKGQKPAFDSLGPLSAPGLPDHEGLYIDFRGGLLRGEVLKISSRMQEAVITDLPLRGDAVIAALREMLTRYGLTAAEAEGLIAAWTPQFFQTEGRRFILRMSPDEYARQCPMQIRPRPTEVVRLGLILTEFDPKPASDAK